MQLGLIGLGRMGGNMRDRVRAAGHEVVGYDPRPEVTDVESLQALAEALDAPRVVWVMVPSGEPTREHRPQAGRGALARRPGDRRRQLPLHRRRAERRAARPRSGIGYVDCGVSGGIWGKENGYGLMAGGSAEHIERAMPIFDALRPEGPREEGFAHAGPVGAGHFSKMVHNGIEYGLMQAYAEGYELHGRDESGHQRDRRYCRPGRAARSCARGCWTCWCCALKDDPGLAKLSDYVDDSGEGRWTIEEAIRHAVPLPVISAALFARFASRQESSPAMKAVAALRHQFGGHAVHQVGPSGTPGQLAGPSSAGARSSGESRPVRRPGPWTPGRRLPTRAPAPPRGRRLPVLGARRARSRARRHRARRAQRVGQDQPGRGGRLPGDARVAPGRGRCPADPARRRARPWSARRWCTRAGS